MVLSGIVVEITVGAPAAIGTLININTAHPAVIEGLLPPELFPSFFVDQILRYRNEVDEEALAEMEGEQREFEEVELQRAIFREDDKIPYRYFRNLEDLANIEGWEERLEAEAEAADAREDLAKRECCVLWRRCAWVVAKAVRAPHAGQVAAVRAAQRGRERRAM